METREIQLTQGQVAIVDAQDYEWLMQWNWYVLKRPNAFYAVRQIRKPNGKQRLLLMHRFIAATPKALETDHIDHNGLNNTRANLRICTKAQNQANSRLRGGTSQFKGVHWFKPTLRWKAQIGLGGKRMSLGYYLQEEDAAKAYNVKAVELFGEFAYINALG